MTLWRKIERDVQDILGEGTLSSARYDAVYWVDILASALNKMSLDTGEIERWDMPEPLGWVAERSEGGLIGGFKSGFAFIDSLNPLSIRLHHVPEPHLPGNRMNDGKADRHGYIWCGTMDMAEEQDSGALYRLSPDGTCEVMDSQYRVPNGPAFSLCGNWLFHSDTAKRIIYRSELSEEGISNRQEFIRFAGDDGYPDGMTVDSEGCLWVAHWGGGRVSRFSPDGEHMNSIALPARQVTNICFAGEGLDRMFVTSASVGLDDVTPYDGAFYEVDCGVKGLPTPLYAG